MYELSLKMADMGPKSQDPGVHVVPEEVLISDESIPTKRFRHRLGARQHRKGTNDKSESKLSY